MTREKLEKLRDAIASVAYDDLEGPVANQDYARQVQQWEQCKRIADAQLAALEAAGVRLVPVDPDDNQLAAGMESDSISHPWEALGVYRMMVSYSPYALKEIGQ